MGARRRVTVATTRPRIAVALLLLLAVAAGPSWARGGPEDDPQRPESQAPRPPGNSDAPPPSEEPDTPPEPHLWGQPDPSARADERRGMVSNQIQARGIGSQQVLEAMRSVPRHLFVPPDYRPQAYMDRPLPIGYGQTISQPYIVAYMTELLELKPGDRVLEIGTGSGYQAAILAEIVSDVYTIEIVEELFRRTSALFQTLGMHEVEVRVGDGYFGIESAAPFDAVIVTAAADHIPPPLILQLAAGGRMVIPVGPAFGTQTIILVKKSTDGAVTRESLLPVRFVPMTGTAQSR